MKKTLLSLLAVTACMGCEGLKMYEMVTDSVINTAVIGGTILGITQVPNIIQFIQDLLGNLGG